MRSETRQLPGLLAAFGCAAAYLLLGRLLNAGCAALPLSSTGQSFVLHCIMAPVAEELAFRGAVQHFLKPFGSRTACWIQAALFAAQHRMGAGMLYAFCMGLGLGWLREHSGSVLPGILVHLLNNLLVFAAG